MSTTKQVKAVKAQPAQPAQPARGVTPLQAKAAAVLAKLPQGAHAGVPLAKLPPSLCAKGASMGALAPALQQVVLVPGIPYKARSVHNATWAALAVRLAAKGATGAALVAGGVPAHSVAAYVKRGWLTTATKK